VQTFANIEAALKSQGAGWGNVVQFTAAIGTFTTYLDQPSL
jgi:hypothetical protein